MITHLGVNNIWAIGVLNKKAYTNALLLGKNSRKKVGTLDSAHQAKKAVQLWQ